MTGKIYRPVIARRDSDEAIHTCLAARWIASLALAMTGKFLGPSSFEARASALAPQDDANSILYLGKICHRAGGGPDFVEQLEAVLAHFCVVVVDHDLVEERV